MPTPPQAPQTPGQAQTARVALLANSNDLVANYGADAAASLLRALRVDDLDALPIRTKLATTKIEALRECESDLLALMSTPNLPDRTRELATERLSIIRETIALAAIIETASQLPAPSQIVHTTPETVPLARLTQASNGEGALGLYATTPSRGAFMSNPTMMALFQIVRSGALIAFMIAALNISIIIPYGTWVHLLCAVLFIASALRGVWGVRRGISMYNKRNTPEFVSAWRHELIAQNKAAKDLPLIADVTIEDLINLRRLIPTHPVWTTPFVGPEDKDCYRLTLRLNSPLRGDTGASYDQEADDIQIARPILARLSAAAQSDNPTRQDQASVWIQAAYPMLSTYRTDPANPQTATSEERRAHEALATALFTVLRDEQAEARKLQAETAAANRLDALRNQRSEAARALAAFIDDDPTTD